MEAEKWYIGQATIACLFGTKSSWVGIALFVIGSATNGVDYSLFRMRKLESMDYNAVLIIISPLERRQSIVMSTSVCPAVCLSVCVCPAVYLPNHTRDLYQIFVHVAYGRGSVLLRQVDDRPHRLLPGRG